MDLIGSKDLCEGTLFGLNIERARKLNQSQGGMCICRKSGIRLGVSQEGFGPCLQDCAAAALDLVFPAGQPGQEAAYPLPCLRRGRLCTAALLPKHRFPGRLFPRPSPNGFIGVEVWAVARQSLPS